MKVLGIVLALQISVGITLVALVATDNLPFVGDDEADGSAPSAARGHVDRFDGSAAFRLLRSQVRLGPRPAGSPESRQLARLLKRIVPNASYQDVPGGLRNVIGSVRGRRPGYVVVGAHYDTKDIPGFVGANDGASGTAVAAQLARSIRQPRHTVKFAFFDGEESPRGTPDEKFEDAGLRGSKVAAPTLAAARAMILLDFVGDRRLQIRYEGNSSPGLWRKLRSAADRVGALEVFPKGEQGAISDDHLPFIDAGVPSIDLIDFDFPCWHRNCDDMSAVSQASVNAVGETIYELLRTL